MQARSVARGGKAIASGVPAGAFSWATIHQFDEKDTGKVKAVTLQGSDVYTGSQSDGIKRWEISTGG